MNWINVHTIFKEHVKIENISRIFWKKSKKEKSKSFIKFLIKIFVKSWIIQIIKKSKNLQRYFVLK